MRRLVAGVLGAIVLVIGIWNVTLGTNRSEARRLMDRGRWSAAREKLSRLLWWSPRDSQLRLMLAEAFARDDSQPAERNAQSAAEILSAIPDQASEAVEARIREARLRFLLLRQPMYAERLLRRALALDANSSDAHSLLWQIMDMTGRADNTESIFRKLYEIGPVSIRIDCLRNWFVNQNEPEQITAELDDLMGFRNSPKESRRLVELSRLVAFRGQESDQPVIHAAVARWFQREGDPEQAMRVLGEGLATPGAEQEPFFVATRVMALLEDGQLDQAEELFARWPEPRDGYEYRKAEGLLREELHRDYRAAAIAYDKAISIWPGTTDWKLRFRRAGCLGLIGEKEAADAVRHQALAVQNLFRPENQRRLRQALLTPRQASSVELITEYYRTLEREDEIRFWQETLRR